MFGIPQALDYIFVFLAAMLFYTLFSYRKNWRTNSRAVQKTLDQSDKIIAQYAEVLRSARANAEMIAVQVERAAAQTHADAEETQRLLAQAVEHLKASRTPGPR